MVPSAWSWSRCLLKMQVLLMRMKNLFWRPVSRQTEVCGKLESAVSHPLCKQEIQLHFLVSLMCLISFHAQKVMCLLLDSVISSSLMKDSL